MQSASADVSTEQTKPVGRDFSLQNILGENPEDVQHPDTKLNGAQPTGWDEESTERPLAEGFCIECEGKHRTQPSGNNADLFPVPSLDQPAQILCETCSDVYCEVCFAAQHRKGSRKRHISRPVEQKPEKKEQVAGGGATRTARSEDDGVSLVTIFETSP